MFWHGLLAHSGMSVKHHEQELMSVPSRLYITKRARFAPTIFHVKVKLLAIMIKTVNFGINHIFSA